jgi:hypothetical protein
MDYWREAVDSSLDEAGVDATEDQRAAIAKDMEGSHECYDMAFYTPPPSDRISAIERESTEKYQALEREFERYRGNAETAVKIALNQHHDTNIGIGDHGEVRRYDGRSDRIQ